MKAWLAQNRRLRLVALTAVAIGLLLPAGDARGQALEHDTSLPIEITADTLEVRQQEQIATFSGNVDAVQGEMVLSADLLRVYYGEREEKERSEGDQPGQSIRRIEAEGNVFLSSPRETAQGEKGTYDLIANQVILEGAVVLTQDDNVIRGERLEIDLTTGHARMLAAAPGAGQATPAQRVRAVFVPQKQPEPAAGPDNAADGEDDAAAAAPKVQ